MLPLYVLIVLAGAGYYASKDSKSTRGSNPPQVNRGDLPSMNDVYDSNYVDKTNAELERINSRAYDRSQVPQKTGVISNNYRLNNDVPNKNVESRLSGVEIPSDEFTHNNMVPYFGGSMRQNMRNDSTQSIMESQTGTFSLLRPKREVESFGDQKEDAGNVYGSSGSYLQMQDRLEPGRSRNNETPFEKVTVGPGIDDGYGSVPSGGFQQFNIQDKVLPKTVDDLRVASKPRMTYAGRIKEGLKHSLPAEIGAIHKNRVDTYYDNDVSRYFTTTGAIIKETGRAEELLKTQERVFTTREYSGNAHVNRGSETRPDVRETSRQHLSDTGLRNTVIDDRGAGERDDHGKASIMVYANERDVTSCRTYEGNIVSAVRAIIAPLEDIARSSIKEYTIANARPNGQFNVQVPGKMTIYDPNDVARTTIKETLIHDPHTGNAAGPQRITVYDPDDIARTTTRQTLPDQENSQNLQGPRKATAYDPSDKARTTTKETTINTDRDGNVHRGILQDGGGYETSIYDVKVTQRQFTTDNDYNGHAYKSLGEGYSTTTYDAKPTQKQFTADNDYYGVMGSSGTDKQKSYSDMYSAKINTTKELVMKGRAPTQTGVKVASGSDTISLDVRRNGCDVNAVRTTGNRNVISSEIPSRMLVDSTSTRGRDYHVAENRLDPSLLTSYVNNPYTHSLSSAV
jgi:hypothetical protein